MNRYVVGGFLAFAFGVAGITQLGLELGPKALAKTANAALSGTDDKAKTEVVVTAEKAASKPHGLEEYVPAK